MTKTKTTLSSLSTADKQKLARRKLAMDFPLYCRKAMKIRTKDGEILPFELNKAQLYLQNAIDKDLRTKGYVRIIILKGRQQGLSTMVGARLYHQVTHARGRKALVMAHKADSTAALFTMTRRYHDHCPDLLKMSTKYSSKRELVFDVLDSAFSVATAGGEGVARGETFTHLHASEMAFWPKSTARDIWNGLVQAVPKSKGTEVYIESTANGVSGLFYEMWTKACAGENDYTPVFIPWFWQDEYAVTPPSDFQRLDEEEAIVEKHGLTDAQLYWRRLKIGETSREQVCQEYPLTADEAFLASGLPAFDPNKVVEMLNAAERNAPREAFLGGAWEDHPRGHLTVFRQPEPGVQYVIGADVGKGIKGADWSVAQVLTAAGEQVAVFRDHVLPDHFATILDSLGRRYNDAKLLVEANDHGVLTNYILHRDLHYPDLYHHTQHDKEDDAETTTLGFTTNVKTRPMVLDKLRADVRDGTITVRCPVTLREFQTFIANNAGKLVAEEGSHDDCVMAIAICNYGRDHIWAPVKVDDSWYCEAL